MVILLSYDEPVEDRFTSFIDTFRGDGNPSLKYEALLSSMAVNGLKSLVIDFNDLYGSDHELATEVIEKPRETIPQMESAALKKLVFRDPAYAKQIKTIRIRIRSLTHMIPLRDIGKPEQIGRLLMVNGFVTQISIPEPFLIRGCWTCTCGENIVIEQKDQFQKAPYTCPSCKNRRDFILDEGNSTFVLSQTIIIQERPEDLSSGQIPRPFKLQLKEDLVETVHPGDRVNATGVLKLLRKIKGGGTLRTYGMALEVNNIDIMSRYMDLVKITKSDEKKLRKLAEDPEIYDKIIDSIAPSIKGRKIIKQAIAHSLFGGTQKILPDIILRAWINLLIIGDYGTGKTQLLEFALRVAPRSMPASGGKHASGVGLTASMIKVDGEYMISPGALALCDLGYVMIDEFDKIDDDEMGALSRPMEQGDLPLAKGGITAVLNARTAIIAAANPTLGRYNPNQTVAQNVTIPPAILSRYDLIFIIKDNPNREEDEEVSRQISALHRGVNPQSPPIDQKDLMKYIILAKRLNPVITEDLDDYIAEYYVQTRNASSQSTESPIAISPRNQEAVIRLAEAKARMHLRDKVEREDLDIAIELMMVSLHQIGIDPTTGELDIDALSSGVPRSLQVQLQKVLGVITKIDQATGAVQDEALFDELQGSYGINRTEAARLIGVLKRDGTIYSPRPGYYKRT